MADAGPQVRETQIGSWQPLLDAAGVALIVLDPTGVVRRWSGAAAALLEIDEATAVGQRLQEDLGVHVVPVPRGTALVVPDVENAPPLVAVTAALEEPPRAVAGRLILAAPGTGAADTRVRFALARARDRLTELVALDDEPVADDDQRLRTLSRRERDVVALLRRGLRVPVIADRLGITERTVHSHLASTFRKLGVHSQRELRELFDRPNEV